MRIDHLEWRYGKCKRAQDGSDQTAGYFAKPQKKKRYGTEIEHGRHDSSGQQDAPVFDSIFHDGGKWARNRPDSPKTEGREHPEVVSQRALPVRVHRIQSEVPRVQLAKHAHRPGLVRVVGSMRHAGRRQPPIDALQSKKRG